MYASQKPHVIGRQTNHRSRSHRPAARGRKPALEGLESRLLLSNTIEGFPVPRSDAYLDVSGGIALGSDGGLWFLVGDTTNRQPTAIERFDPATHAYTSFPFADTVPAGLNEPVDPTELTSGPDGNIWFTLPYTAGSVASTSRPMRSPCSRPPPPEANPSSSPRVPTMRSGSPKWPTIRSAGSMPRRERSRNTWSRSPRTSRPATV